jgi:preprotein translocase subunit SecD
MDVLRKIIKERAHTVGAENLRVTTELPDRIVAEFTGVQDLPRAVHTIQGRGFLEFVSSGDTPLDQGTRICTRLGGCPQAETEFTGVPFDATIPRTTVATVGAAAGTPQAQATALSKIYETIISADEIDENSVELDRDYVGRPQVKFKLKGDGPQQLAAFTRDNIDKYMPIVLDGRVLSSPIIRGIIPDGIGVIEGLTLAEANELVIQLKSGPLPLYARLIKASQVYVAPNTTGWIAIGLILGIVFAIILVILIITLWSTRKKQSENPV